MAQVTNLGIALILASIASCALTEVVGLAPEKLVLALLAMFLVGVLLTVTPWVAGSL